MADTAGYYRKYKVERTDGRDAPGEKHHGHAVVVLDLECDPHARTALRVYALLCRKKAPYRQALANDLTAMLEEIEGRQGSPR